MRTHKDVDLRSAALAAAIAEKVDRDPSLLAKARSVCSKWYSQYPQPALQEWRAILERPWNEIRAILLEDSEKGRRLRQSNPFCGILTPRERWALYREYREQ